MKRILCFFISLILVFTSFIVPAFAAELDTLVNLLDYGTITNGNTGNYLSSSSTRLNVKYDLPYQAYFSYVDCLFWSTTLPSSVMVTDFGSGTTLTVVSLGSNVYRAYGHINKPPRRTDISLYFNYPNSTTRTLEIYSLNVSLSQTAFVSTALDSTLTVYVNNNDATVDIPAGDSHTTFMTGSTESLDFEAFTTIHDWQGYDYLDFHFSVWGDTVDSVDVTLGRLTLPYEMTFVDSNGIYDDPTDGSANSLYYVSLRIYFDGVDRTINVDPVITVSGRFTGNGFISVDAVFGSILNVEVDQTLSFWNKLTKFFTGLIGSTSDQQQSADDFEQSAEDQSDRLEYADAEIAEIEKPFLGDMNFEVNDMVDPNVLTLSTSGISSALSNNIFLKVLIMALTLALAGFILYGKK